MRALQTPELGRPLALGAVLEDAVKRKELIPLGDFLDRKESVYAKSWIPTPWQVVSWGLRQLGVLGREGAEDRLVKGNFVVMVNVEVRGWSGIRSSYNTNRQQAAAKAAIQQIADAATSNTSRIFSRDLFASQFAANVGVDTISARDLSVLLTHLSRDQRAITYDAKSGVIKFRAPSETAPHAIEQEDITIASLRTLIATVEPQIQQLTKHVSQLDIKAREAVTNKQLINAKTALRQKKLTETKLQQRTATLTQVEEVYAKIEQAADQVEIVRVMEASSQTLRALNAKTGGVERVQDIMESLAEEMGNTEEISQAINDVGVDSVDEGEVEDELEAMEKVEREKVEEAERSEREKREEVERKERESREEAEAETVRRRLAELEKLGAKEVTAPPAVSDEAIQQEAAQ